jgi:hypothetical protein
VGLTVTPLTVTIAPVTLTLAVFDLLVSIVEVARMVKVLAGSIAATVRYPLEILVPAPPPVTVHVTVCAGPSVPFTLAVNACVPPLATFALAGLTVTLLTVGADGPDGEVGLLQPKSARTRHTASKIPKFRKMFIFIMHLLL